MIRYIILVRCFCTSSAFLPCETFRDSDLFSNRSFSCHCQSALGQWAFSSNQPPTLITPLPQLPQSVQFKFITWIWLFKFNTWIWLLSMPSITVSSGFVPRCKIVTECMLNLDSNLFWWQFILGPPTCQVRRRAGHTKSCTGTAAQAIIIMMPVPGQWTQSRGRFRSLCRGNCAVNGGVTSSWHVSKSESGPEITSASLRPGKQEAMQCLCRAVSSENFLNCGRSKLEVATFRFPSFCRLTGTGCERHLSSLILLSENPPWGPCGTTLTISKWKSCWRDKCKRDWYVEEENESSTEIQVFSTILWCFKGWYF